jgi:hypothetical protein
VGQAEGAHVSLGAEVDLRHVAGQDAFVRGQQQLYLVALRCEGKGTVAWVLLEECVCGPPVVMASVATGHLRDSITPHRLQLAIGELTDNHHDDGVAQLFDSEVAATTDIVGGSVSPAAGNHGARAFEQDKKASGAGPVDTGPVATNTSATFDDDTKTSQPEKETGASFVLHEAGAFEHGDALSGNSVDTADVRCAPCKIACSAGVDQMQGTWNNLQPMYKLLWLMGVLALAVLGFTVLIIIPGSFLLLVIAWTALILRFGANFSIEGELTYDDQDDPHGAGEGEDHEETASPLSGNASPPWSSSGDSVIDEEAAIIAATSPRHPPSSVRAAVKPTSPTKTTRSRPDAEGPGPNADK